MRIKINKMRHTQPQQQLKYVKCNKPKAKCERKFVRNNIAKVVNVQMKRIHLP